jgi:hypothetical protein
MKEDANMPDHYVLLKKYNSNIKKQDLDLLFSQNSWITDELVMFGINIMCNEK